MDDIELRPATTKLTQHASIGFRRRRSRPGLPEHHSRPTDVGAGAARRAERQVAAMFALSMICACCSSSPTSPSKSATQRHIPQSRCLQPRPRPLSRWCPAVHRHWHHPVGAQTDGRPRDRRIRHPAASSEADREVTLDAFKLGLEESGIGRRPLIATRCSVPSACSDCRPIVLLRDLGPTRPGRRRREAAPAHDLGAGHAPGPGRRRHADQGLRARDRRPRQRRTRGACSRPRRTASPRSRASSCRSPRPRARSSSCAWSPTRSRPAGRENWTVDGIICYSKICTHVGCPISLYERTTHHVLCPCHQSTFDLADSAKVIFGPAARPLPQLPLAVDDEGYLVAQSDFDEPVGAKLLGARDTMSRRHRARWPTSNGATAATAPSRQGRLLGQLDRRAPRSGRR